jgi:uncharacterized protein
MLGMKSACERCGVGLPEDSTDARICSYECTFCVGCSENVLKAICPNCGGELVRRPVRRAS